MRSRWRSGSAVIAGTARAPASSCPRGARAQAPGGKGGSVAEPGQAAARLEKCLLREIVCERGVAAAEMTEEAAHGGTVAFHPEPDRSAGVVGDVAGDEFAVGHGGGGRSARGLAVLAAKQGGQPRAEQQGDAAEAGDGAEVAQGVRPRAEHPPEAGCAGDAPDAAADVVVGVGGFRFLLVVVPVWPEQRQGPAAFECAAGGRRPHFAAAVVKYSPLSVNTSARIMPAVGMMRPGSWPTLQSKRSARRGGVRTRWMARWLAGCGEPARRLDSKILDGGGRPAILGNRSPGRATMQR